MEQNLMSVTNGSPKFDYSKPETCSSIYTSISVIANTISKLPLHIYKETENGREIYKDHKWYNAIRYSPDGNLSTSKWLGYSITQMYLTGNAFFIISQFDEDLNSDNKKLIAVPELEKVIYEGGQYWYKFKNIPWIPQKQLIHFYDLSKDGVLGLNPIESLRNELDIQAGSEGALKTYLKNGLMSNIYIESNVEGVGNVDKNKAKEYFEQLQQEFTGWHNSGKIAKIPPLYSIKALPQNQIDYLTNSKYTISQIAALFKVPGFYLGVQDGSSTYGKAEEQQLAFKNICLSNVCSKIKLALEHGLLTYEERSNGISIDFDYSNLYDTDLTTKSNYLKSLASIGAVSPNQIAQAFGLPKIKGENGDLHFVQKQYFPLEWYSPTMNPDNNMNQVIEKDNEEPTEPEAK